MCTHPISPVNGSAASYVSENRLRRTSPRASWRSIRSPGELAEHPAVGEVTSRDLVDRDGRTHGGVKTASHSCLASSSRDSPGGLT
jgi:hypothetical protein